MKKSWETIFSYLEASVNTIRIVITFFLAIVVFIKRFVITFFCQILIPEKGLLSYSMSQHHKSRRIVRKTYSTMFLFLMLIIFHGARN